MKVHVPFKKETRPTIKDNIVRVEALIPYTQLVQSAGVVEYSDCITGEGRIPHPMSVLYMILNNLMVSFRECGVPHCHRF